MEVPLIIERSDLGSVYAIGDVHGCSSLLKELLEEIEQEADREGVAPKIVFLGDYIDRGPDSRGVIETAIRYLEKAGPENVFFLRGNHEDMLMQIIDEQNANLYVTWFVRNGGAETLQSYGWHEPYPPDPTTLQTLLPESHWHFLRGTSHMLLTPGCAFVHAGIDPHRSIRSQDAQTMMWIRRAFLDHPSAFEKFIVHGHTPQDPASLTANEHRCNLDSKAYRRGVLTAGLIDSCTGRLMRTLQTSPSPKLEQSTLIR